MLPASLTFWLAAAAMVAIALAFVLPALLRRGRSRGTAPPAPMHAILQHPEVDAATRGSPSDAGAAGGAQEAVAGGSTSTPSRGHRAALAVAIALPLVAVALYLAVGKPSAIDAPNADPPPATANDAFRAQLQAHLASSPRDGRAWVTLARLEMNADRFNAAGEAYAKALAASAKIARDPGVLCEYADALGMAQGGRLEGPPTPWIERALAIDPSHPKALEMAGSLAYERRDFRTAVRHWRALLDQIETGSPAHAELSTAIQRAERLASTALPPASAPSAPGG
jgi:cytochrome c-type biogenesis protein CcmH